MVLEALTAMSPEDRRELSELLAACVDGGASIGFLAPVPAEEVDAYWRKIGGDLATGNRVLLIMRADANGRIEGTAQLALETRANGRHRAEVQKVLVSPGQRRKGWAVALMTRIEAEAVARAVKLLFLDTSEGKGGAAALYTRLGYVYAGGIPGYALDPDGTPVKNAIFYKTLAPRG